MRSDLISAARDLAADLDILADRAQALFDDASAEAYATSADPFALSCDASDHLDALYDAAERAAAAATAARLSI